MGKVLEFKNRDYIDNRDLNEKFVDFARVIMYVLNNFNEDLYKPVLERFLFYIHIYYYKITKEYLISDDFYFTEYGVRYALIDDFMGALSNGNFVDIIDTELGVLYIPIAKPVKLNDITLGVVQGVMCKFEPYTFERFADYLREEEFWDKSKKGKRINITNIDINLKHGVDKK